MNIYVFSGLGADERAFAKLNFPAHFTLVHMPWLSPLKNETLEQYAQRLAEKIDQRSPYMLMGLSFGGLIAGEIARQHDPVLTILLSSMRTGGQKPWFYRIARFTRVYRIFPYGLFKRGNFFTYKAFGVKHPEDKVLLKKIMQDTGKTFFKWAMARCYNGKTISLQKTFFIFMAQKTF